MTTETDPILELIERHRTAANAWYEAERALDRLQDSDAPGSPPRSRAYAEAMGDTQAAAFVALFTTPPATIAGAVALLRYVQEAETIGDHLLEFRINGHRVAGLALVASLLAGLEQIATVESGGNA